MRTIALSVALALMSAAGIPQTPAAPDLVVSREWLASHLNDPAVAIIATGEIAGFNKKHITGARFLAHEDTMDANHRLLEPAELSKAPQAVGVTAIVTVAEPPAARSPTLQLTLCWAVQVPDPPPEFVKLTLVTTNAASTVSVTVVAVVSVPPELVTVIV